MDIRLNLIPWEKRKKIEKNEKFSQLVKTEMGLTAVILCFLTVLFCFQFILNMNYQSNLSSWEKNNKEEKYVKIHNFDEQFSEINSQVSKIMTVEKDQIYWTNLFPKLSSVIFPGIKINVLETNDCYVTLKGLADNRDNLILFKEKLGNLDCLTDINLPLSELVEKDNVEFQIDFIISRECLKQK